MIPTSTNVAVDVKSKTPADVDAVVLFIAQGVKAIDAEALSAQERVAGERLIRAGAVQGKPREFAFDLVESGKGFRRVYVIGLGEEKKLTTETLRQAAGAAAKAFRKHRMTRVALALPQADTLAAPEAADAIATGLLLAAFHFREFKGAAKKFDDGVRKDGALRVTILSEDDQVTAAVNRARIICEGQNFARTIASRPGNVVNPPALARVAQDMARDAGLKFRVMDEKEMGRLGMGGILAVGSGSAHPPRMIVMEWNGAPRSTTSKSTSKAATARGQRPRGISPNLAAPLLVVGKAITFDTGGISIKPADKMGEMIFDKCGAMAVLGLMYAVAKLKLPINVVGILASAENMPSGTSYRPGDILKMYNGVTVEVTNTDAEGRLVLGDALAWGIETYQPAAVVDLATLTGGCVIALGHTQAGLMSNNDSLVAELQQAADRSAEKIWRLPVGKDQRDAIKSNHADIINSAGRAGSPITAGAFLSYFVPRDNSVPWAHFDIAGVADTDKELPYYPKGATGWGVRMLINWVAARAAHF
ncbi:MAG TPA: leucyl aminopeptidase [Tepidisphaeraceae bacterium]